MLEISIMTEEEFLALSGYGRNALGDCALHKNIPEGNIRKKLLNHQLHEDHLILAKRVNLRIEYRKKVETGEIRPPTRLEKLERLSAGHIDNEVTRAARRLLKKRRIFQSKKKFKEGMQKIREKNTERQPTARRKTKLVNPVPNPRYDDIYYDGLKWLDSLAGPPLPKGRCFISLKNPLIGKTFGINLVQKTT